MNIIICNKIDFASTDVSKIILCLSIYDSLQPTSSRTHHSTHYSRTLQQDSVQQDMVQQDSLQQDSLQQDSTAGLYSRTDYIKNRYPRRTPSSQPAGELEKASP